MSDLDLLLSVPALMEPIEEYPSLSQPLPYTQVFQMGERKEVEGDRLIFGVTRNDRTLAAVRSWDSDGFKRKEPDVDEVMVGMIESAEEEDISAKRLFTRWGRGSFMKSDAQKIVSDTVKRLLSRQLRKREYICSRLLTTAAGVSITPANTDFPAGAVQDSYTVTIHGGLNTGAAPSTWDLATTQIMSDITQLPSFKQALEDGGFNAKHFFGSLKLEAVMFGNAEVKEWLNNTAKSIKTIEDFLRAGSRAQGDLAASPESGPIAPNAFSGLAGIPNFYTMDHYFIDGAGAKQRYHPKTVGLLIGHNEYDILGFAEGLVALPDPSKAGIIGDGVEALEMFQTKYGIAFYAYIAPGSKSITIACVDSFRPFVKNRLGVYAITGLVGA